MGILQIIKEDFLVVNSLLLPLNNMFNNNKNQIKMVSLFKLTKILKKDPINNTHLLKNPKISIISVILIT
jgi:hypothetical protein